MEAIRKKIFNEDYDVHSCYDRKVPLNLVINSKSEIITTHRNNIHFFSKEFYHLENTINIKEDKIRDIVLINDDLILAIRKGN